MLQPVLHSFRFFRRYPLDTFVGICTLSVALAAGAIVFAVADGILFRSLPYPESERIFRVHGREETCSACN